ncbi:hypothetical protein RND81_05G265800 [Saponaria officinalis]|uniref:non-specific serine/threonine protein kinase n=1 Tax=Saponaria officinalis TaxID=3572 RepID=A0AAW1L342_SAPOF
MVASKLHFVISVYFFTLPFTTCAKTFKQFTYNGFKQQTELRLDGGATVHPNGLLQLTNTSEEIKSHVFDPVPLEFISRSSLSFSTAFAFAIYPKIQAVSGDGIAFVLTPSMDFSLATAAEFFGIFNATTVGNFSNHIFAVEIDTVQNIQFQDIDSNHIGIDVNNLQSIASASASYFSEAEARNKSLDLKSAKPMQIWIDYDDIDMVVEVTLAPLSLPRPSKPLLSTRVNLSQVVRDKMFVGLVSSTSQAASSHYVLGWSFSQGRKAQARNLDLSKLPTLPRYGNKKRQLSTISMILVILTSLLLIVIGFGVYLRWKKKFEEILEDWEQEYILQRFLYKNLYKATKGFKNKELLGIGGFGEVYKGKLPCTKVEVAVKKVCYNSVHGMREFVAEIACMAKLRHKNLVKLLGYCRRKGELFLVYDYMLNGSLDKHLYNHETTTNLSWSNRFKIIKDVAYALLYLHEEWEQVIVHRDVKPSNVLLDANMNARLGDFGLARLYDHGANPQTTHVVGTVGYLAPELIRRGKASTVTDVYSFGITILEIACGRSPVTIEIGKEWNLLDFVYDCWVRGVIVEASDSRLVGSYVLEEMETVLKLGMLCSHPRPETRPKMRQVIEFLDGDYTLPEISIPYNAKKMVFSTSTSDTLPSFSSSAGVDVEAPNNSRSNSYVKLLYTNNEFV